MSVETFVVQMLKEILVGISENIIHVNMEICSKFQNLLEILKKKY